MNVNDDVTAAGNIVARQGVAPAICRGLFFVDDNPGCTGRADLSNVDAEAVSGSRVGNWWVTDYVTVEGTWSGDAIQVTGVFPSEEPIVSSSTKYVPCGEPPQGWPGGGPNSDEAASSLVSYVDARPDDYVGTWWTEIADTAGMTTGFALVVGAVNDISSAYGDLRPIYPFNLCVIHAPFSATMLNELRDRLAAADSRWHVSVEPSIDRVLVKTPIYDARLADAIGAQADLVVIDPVVIARSN